MRKYRLNSLSVVMSLVVIATAAFAACGGISTEKAPTVVPQTTLTISGAGGTTRVLRLLSDAYVQQHRDLAFDFLSGSGSSGGVKGVLGGQLYLGAMSRLPKEAELSAGIQYLNFAQDRVAVVTSPDLSITGLTTQQVNGIFLGTITSWSEVGGPEAPINVLVRGEKDSNTKILRKGIIGDADFAAGSVVMASESDTKAALSSATNTIGYLAYSGVRIENLPVHALSIDGQDPADVTGGYPLAVRPLGVAYLPANAAKVQSFLNFMIGPEAQVLLGDRGIISVNSGAQVKGQ